MSVQVNCNGCRKRVSLPDDATTRAYRCPSCKTLIEPGSVYSAQPPQFAPPRRAVGAGDGEQMPYRTLLSIRFIVLGAVIFIAPWFGYQWRPLVKASLPVQFGVGALVLGLGFVGYLLRPRGVWRPFSRQQPDERNPTPANEPFAHSKAQRTFVQFVIAIGVVLGFVIVLAIAWSIAAHNHKLPPFSRVMDDILAPRERPPFQGRPDDRPLPSFPVPPTRTDPPPRLPKPPSWTTPSPTIRPRPAVSPPAQPLPRPPVFTPPPRFEPPTPAGPVVVNLPAPPSTAPIKPPADVGAFELAITFVGDTDREVGMQARYVKYVIGKRLNYEIRTDYRRRAIVVRFKHPVETVTTALPRHHGFPWQGARADIPWSFFVNDFAPRP